MGNTDILRKEGRAIHQYLSMADTFFVIIPDKRPDKRLDKRPDWQYTMCPDDTATAGSWAGVGLVN
jgi:hypothetical protein